MLLFCSLNCTIADDSVAWIADLSFQYELLCIKAWKCFNFSNQLKLPLLNWIWISLVLQSVTSFRFLFLFFFSFGVGNISAVLLRWMKKKVNKCTDQDLDLDQDQDQDLQTELWNIHHKEKEKESRRTVQEKKKNHPLLFTEMVRISQQV